MLPGPLGIQTQILTTQSPSVPSEGSELIQALFFPPKDPRCSSNKLSHYLQIPQKTNETTTQHGSQLHPESGAGYKRGDNNKG